MTIYILGGGCFWCLDAVYRRIKGVSSVESGYSGGNTPSPTYEEVSSGTTGHTEVVKVSFDETIIPAETVLDIFFLIHDPTTPNRQGNDVGTQYRSALFYADDTQKDAFHAAIDRAQPNWKDTIVTEVSKLDTFYTAEEYHQDYFNRNPGNGYCSVVITPKIIKARAAYLDWFIH